MKTLLFSMLVLLNFQFASASVSLPAPIIEMQNVSAVQGTCQKNWQELAEIFKLTKEVLNDRQVLYVVPCALWADNVAYTAFVTIRESSHPDGFLTKKLFFVNYHPFEGIVARDVIHNMDWDSETKTMRAQYYVNGSQVCGSRAVYKWDSGYQTLKVTALLKQDKCNDPSAPWLPVFN